MGTKVGVAVNVLNGMLEPGMPDLRPHCMNSDGIGAAQDLPVCPCNTTRRVTSSPRATRLQPKARRSLMGGNKRIRSSTTLSGALRPFMSRLLQNPETHPQRVFGFPDRISPRPIGWRVSRRSNRPRLRKIGDDLDYGQCVLRSVKSGGGPPLPSSSISFDTTPVMVIACGVDGCKHLL